LRHSARCWWPIMEKNLVLVLEELPDSGVAGYKPLVRPLAHGHRYYLGVLNR